MQGPSFRVIRGALEAYGGLCNSTRRGSSTRTLQTSNDMSAFFLHSGGRTEPLQPVEEKAPSTNSSHSEDILACEAQSQDDLACGSCRVIEADASTPPPPTPAAASAPAAGSAPFDNRIRNRKRKTLVPTLQLQGCRVSGEVACPYTKKALHHCTVTPPASASLQIRQFWQHHNLYALHCGFCGAALYLVWSDFDDSGECKAVVRNAGWWRNREG